MMRIYDTTLRDGEQAPGFAMQIKEKLLIAKYLEMLGVDAIEAGFPIASQDDLTAVSLIAASCQNTEVSALCRSSEKDIDAAIEALKNAAKPRIHVFIATSDIHLEYKLKISRQKAIEKAVHAIRYAKEFTPRVEFSCEDATRSDPKFLVEILSCAIEAGADILNIPDTVGYSHPQEYGELINYLLGHIKNIDKAILSTHCHDDLGLAVANSLSGIKQGAKQIECTINGIGERAGNAPLEEIVMAIKTRHDFFYEHLSIHTERLFSTCKLVSQITGAAIPPNKAITGRNAFAHGSGIHQHGMLSKKGTYEIIAPETVGMGSSEIVLSKHSGRHALIHRLQILGISLDDASIDQLFIKFKELADKKKEVFDDDLIMLLLHDSDRPMPYELVKISASLSKKTSKASITIKINGKKFSAKAKGNGPVQAAYNALITIAGIKGSLEEFHISNYTPHEEAMGLVDITWKDENDKLWKGQDVDANIVIASVKALINMLNRKSLVTNMQHTKEKPYL